MKISRLKLCKELLKAIDDDKIFPFTGDVVGDEAENLMRRFHQAFGLDEIDEQDIADAYLQGFKDGKRHG